jgi:predicted DNA-binding transcriptional regulator YafY
MPRASGGDKRSSWLTFQRRLFIVRRLIRGPADAATLVAEARAMFGDSEIYPPEDRQALRHDLAKLRGEFGCEIRLGHDRRYYLDSPGRLAVLDLPDHELEALAFLRITFAEDQLPNADTIGTLIDRIASLLPAERRSQLERLGAQPRMDHPRTIGEAEQRAVAKIKRAVGRQQIRFAYRASHTPSETPIQHRVAPYDLFYRDGHTYLEAYCLECGIPGLAETYVTYRIDRIAANSLSLLPTRLPPGQPSRRRFSLRYLLSPLIARRRDIALWFTGSEVEFRPDGSAEVTAQISDLWQARQILLRYREHCHVLHPPELVEMIRETVERMGQMYTTDHAARPIA